MRHSAARKSSAPAPVPPSALAQPPAQLVSPSLPPVQLLQDVTPLPQTITSRHNNRRLSELVAELNADESLRVLLNPLEASYHGVSSGGGWRHSCDWRMLASAVVRAWEDTDDADLGEVLR